MFNPTEDRVVLKPVPPETLTKSGLIIPIEAQKTKMYEIVALGPTANGLTKLEPGMLVMVPNGAGFEYTDDDQELLCVRHTSIDLYDYKK